MTQLTPVFVLTSEYQRPIAEVETVLPQHTEWVAAGYEHGRILVSGRRQPPVGGIIVAIGENRQDIQRWLAADPFVLAGLAEYKIEEFGATDFPKRSRGFDMFLQAHVEKAV
jgi:uncharacterized protein YciI